MNEHNQYALDCIQFNVVCKKRELRVSALKSGASIAASAVLIDNTIQASAKADNTLAVDAHSLTPPLKVTASLVCDVREIAPVEGYFITADGFIFATADGYIFRPADL